MATSGTTNTELTRDEIVEAALRKLGRLAQGQAASSADLADGAEALNNLVAEFQTMGMPLWARKSLNITMVADQASYVIGVGLATNTAFPLKIIQAWTEPTSGGGRQPLEQLAIYDYNLLPTASSGSPSQFSYQPNINYGTLRLWPAPDTSTVANRTLTISYQCPFDEFTASGNTPYFPKEWNNALIYGLADLLSGEWGLPLNDRREIEQKAEKHLNIALDFGQEQASIFFAPDGLQ